MNKRSPRRARTALSGLLAGLVLIGGHAAPVAAEATRDGGPGGSTVWLCHPGQRAADACRSSMATTVQRHGAPDRVVDPGMPARQPVDCFYVYPTVSEEPTLSASLEITPHVRAIAEHQAARFSQVCDVYAPVYRQRTLTALQNPGGYTPEQLREASRIAYGDVARAWQEYLAQAEPGRGVVLVGHSQGTGMLRQLIRNEIDPKPEARARLVSALLLGGNVLVRKGSDRGGDFATVPLCRSERQTGCAVGFATFNATPPADSAFGRSPSVPDPTGGPWGPEYEAACTNPASLKHNHARTARTLVRTDPVPGLLGQAVRVMYNGAPPTADTPWVVPADRHTVQCVRAGGAHVLMATPTPGSSTLTPSPNPAWGLHLADVNLALGDLVNLIRIQSRAYAHSHQTGR